MVSLATPYYVYEWIRPDIDVVFYVGKGRGRRAWNFKRNGTHVKNVINKLNNNGLKPIVRILAHFTSERGAFDFEMERIAFWAPVGELSNKTKGGDGPSGYKWTDDQKNKLRLVAKAVQNCPETIRKKSDSRLNFLTTDKGIEWRERQKDRLRNFFSTPRGKEASTAHGRAIAEFFRTERGRLLVEEQSTRAKLQTKGEGNPNSTITEEIAQKILDFNGTRYEAAKHFGVTYNIASGIKSGRTWSHLKRNRGV